MRTANEEAKQRALDYGRGDPTGHSGQWAQGGCCRLSRRSNHRTHHRMTAHTAHTQSHTQRTGSAGPQFAESLLAAVLVALKEHAEATRMLAEAVHGASGARGIIAPATRYGAQSR